MQRSLGTASGATRATGDFNGDGAVNRQDAAILARNFGRSLPALSPAPAAVVAWKRVAAAIVAPRSTSPLAAPARRRIVPELADRALDQATQLAVGTSSKKGLPKRYWMRRVSLEPGSSWRICTLDGIAAAFPR